MLERLYRFLDQRIIVIENELGAIKSFRPFALASIVQALKLFIIEILKSFVAILILLFENPKKSFEILRIPAPAYSFEAHTTYHKRIRFFSLYGLGSIVAAVVIISLVLNLITPNSQVPSFAATFSTIWTTQGDFDSNTATGQGATTRTNVDTTSTANSVQLSNVGLDQSFTETFTNTTNIDTANSTDSASGVSGGQLALTTGTATDLSITGKWSELTANGAGGSPSIRSGVKGTVWDTQNNRLLVFDGVGGGSDDLWGYSGTWSLVAASGGPLRAGGISAAWDSTNNRLLVFGGNSGATYYNDLWCYASSANACSSGSSANAWTQLTADGAVGSPVRRTGQAMAWDSANNRLLMFGGSDVAANLNDLWSYSGTTWTQVTANGAVGSPAARGGHTVAWDSANNRLLMFGGYAVDRLNDLWSYTSVGGWSQLTANGAAGSPSQRFDHDSAWDNLNNKLLVFGGNSNLGTTTNDLWAWNGSVWSQLTANGAAGSPTQRRIMGTAWNSQTHRLLMFGGSDATAARNDLSEFAPFPSAVSAATRDGSGNIYLGGAGGKFWKYVPSTSTFTDLTGKISGFWGTNNINVIEFDATNNAVYLGGYASKFAKCDVTACVNGASAADDLSAKIAWGATRSVNGLIYDSVDNMVYLAGGESDTISKFAKCDVTACVNGASAAADLSGKIFGVFGTSAVQAMTLDTTNRVLYFGGGNNAGGQSYFAKCGITTCVNGASNADNLTSLVPNYLNNRRILSLVFDPANQAIYGGSSDTASSPKTTFFKCSIANNNPCNGAGGNATDLEGRISAFWGANSVSKLALDTVNSVVYLGGTAGNFAKCGVAGCVNGASNATNLRSPDKISFWSTNDVNALVYDSTNSLIYLGGAGGKFAKFTAVGNTQSVQSIAVDTLATNIVYATLTKNDTPGTGSITYQLSNDNGTTWNYLTSIANTYPAGVTVEEWLIQQNAVNATTCNTTNRICNSLASWEDAADGTGSRNLVTENKIAVAKIDGAWTVADTIAVTINGWTTDATHYIRIYTTPAARHTGKWDAGKYRLEITNARAMQVNEEYVRIEGLQVQVTSNIAGSGSGGGIYMGYQGMPDVATDVHLSHNIIKGVMSGPIAIFLALALGHSNLSVTKAWNNIVYDWNNTSDALNSQYAIFANDGTVYIYNNTVYNSKFGFISGSAADAKVLKNNLSYNNAVNLNFSDYAITSTISNNNLSSDATSPDIAYRSKVVSFVNAASRDLRLASTDTAAKNAGFDLSTDANLPFNTDIEGEIRSGTWDIGAHEQDGTFEKFTFPTSGSSLKWKATLTGNATVQDITITYNGYNTTGTITNLKQDAGGNAVWGTISWNATTPTGTSVKFRTRGATAAQGLGALGTAPWSSYYTTSGASITNESGAINPTYRYLEIEMYLDSGTTGGTATPTITDFTAGYVINAAPELTSVTASQSGTDSKVTVNFSVRDTDTNSGTTNPGRASLSLEYCTNAPACSTWSAATTVTGDVGLKQVCDGNGGSGGLNCALTQYTAYSMIWTPATDYANQYSSAFKVRVRGNDNEGAFNNGYGESLAFEFDTKAPTLGSPSIKIDGTTNNLTFLVTDDNLQNPQMQMDLAVDCASLPGTWINFASPYDATSLIGAANPKTVCVRFRDAYKNTTANTLASNSSAPANLLLQDTTNKNISQHQMFLSWGVVASATKYHIYRSIDNFTTRAEVGTITSPSAPNTNYFTDTNFSTTTTAANYFGKTFSYRITAEDVGTNESAYSETKSGSPDGVTQAQEGGGTGSSAGQPSGDTVPPAITSVNVKDLGPASATITWNTNEISNSAVNYGFDASFPNQQHVASFVTYHEVTLTGLTPKRAYVFKVSSTDASSNTATSNNGGAGYTFTTPEQELDSTPPKLVNLDITSAANGVTVTWETDELSSSFIDTGLAGKEYTKTNGKDEKTLKHTVTINDLSPETDYRLRAVSFDAAKNRGISPDLSFRTLSTDSERNALEAIQELLLSGNAATQESIRKALDEASQKLPAPQILGDAPKVEVTSTTAKIRWATNVPANSMVAIVPNVQYSATSEDPYIMTTGNFDEQTLSHEVTLINLAPATLYHYQLRSKPTFGPEGSSRDLTFSTRSLAPEIFGEGMRKVSQNQATIAWSTNVQADSLVRYTPYRRDKPNLAETKLQGTPDLVFDHEITVVGLEYGTLYAIELQSTDRLGNVITKSLKPFSTSIDLEAPKVSQIRTESAIVSGAREQVQTIIFWKTDEPATSQVMYQEGIAENKELERTTIEDPNLTQNHVAVITSFKPGVVYRFKVRSRDAYGNPTESSNFTILAPTQRETVFQIILKNFEDTFGWVRKLKL